MNLILKKKIEYENPFKHTHQHTVSKRITNYIQHTNELFTGTTVPIHTHLNFQERLPIAGNHCCLIPLETIKITSCSSAAPRREVAAFICIVSTTTSRTMSSSVSRNSHRALIWIVPTWPPHEPSGVCLCVCVCVCVCVSWGVLVALGIADSDAFARDVPAHSV